MTTLMAAYHSVIINISFSLLYRVFILNAQVSSEQNDSFQKWCKHQLADKNDDARKHLHLHRLQHNRENASCIQNSWVANLHGTVTSQKLEQQTVRIGDWEVGSEKKNLKSDLRLFLIAPHLRERVLGFPVVQNRIHFLVCFVLIMVRVREN